MRLIGIFARAIIQEDLISTWSATVDHMGSVMYPKENKQLFVVV